MDIMADADRTALYQDALDLWGVDAQVCMAVEEMSELAVCLMHCRRGRVPGSSIADEVADVLIMLEQIIWMFAITPEQLERLCNKKLARLAERIKTNATKQTRERMERGEP